MSLPESPVETVTVRDPVVIDVDSGCVWNNNSIKNIKEI